MASIFGGLTKCLVIYLFIYMQFLVYSLKKLFLMWTIFKVFIEFVTILLLFWFYGHKACGILAPQPGIEPAPAALEGEVLTTGSPGKS